MNITLCTFLLNIYYDTIFLQTVRSKSFHYEHNPSLYLFLFRKQFLFRFQIKLISSKSTRFLAISHTDHRLVRIHLESSTHDEEGRRKGRPGSPLIRIINEAARRGWSFADHYPRPPLPFVFVFGIFISTRLDLAGIHPWSSKYHFKRIPRPVSAAADK